jgi:hypothetical protein
MRKIYNSTSKPRDCTAWNRTLVRQFRWLFMIALFAVITPSIAQERVVSGKVTSVDDGSSLPGVNIILKGTSTGVVTDAQGNYSIAVGSSGGTLVFSFIGYKTTEVDIGARSEVNVQLVTDVTQLTEVVVTSSVLKKANSH